MIRAHCEGVPAHLNGSPPFEREHIAEAPVRGLAQIHAPDPASAERGRLPAPRLGISPTSNAKDGAHFIMKLQRLNATYRQPP